MAAILNGRIPVALLARCPWPEVDHLYLRPGAAYWLGRLAAEFEAHFGKPLYLSDAYRTYDAQVRLKAQKGRFAATPGKSNHGLGVAIDAASRVNVDTSAEHRWFEDNALRFGWINPGWATDRNPANGEYEPWHWEFVKDPDAVPTSAAPIAEPAQSTPAAPSQEPTMRVIQGHGSPHVYSTDGVTKVHLTTGSQVADMLRVAGQAEVVVVGMETIGTLPTYTAPVAVKVPTVVQIADEVWSRTLGMVGGKRRTAGQGVQLAARAAVGEDVGGA